MTDEFNKQFIIFGFKQLDNPAFLSFIGTAEFKTFLILSRYIWRGGAHRLGLEDRYAKEKLLVAAVDRTFIAHKLGLQDETRISKHLTKLEELKIIVVLLRACFGKSKQQSSLNETQKGSDGEQLSDVAQNATSDVQNTPHQKWLQEPQQTWRGEPRSNKYKINKKTVNVNGDVDTAAMQHQSHEEMDRTDLRRLPDLDQDREKTQSVAEFILDELGDEHCTPPSTHALFASRTLWWGRGHL